MDSPRPIRWRSGWLVESRTLRGVQYFVCFFGKRCTCRGFVIRGFCWHSQQIQALHERLVRQMKRKVEHEDE